MQSNKAECQIRQDQHSHKWIMSTKYPDDQTLELVIGHDWSQYPDDFTVYLYWNDGDRCLLVENLDTYRTMVESHGEELSVDVFQITESQQEYVTWMKERWTALNLLVNFSPM